MSTKRILLLEPNYKNKYPPLALMKLATYHRRMGDSVTFYKGDLNALVVKILTDLCIEKLHKVEADIFWNKYRDEISRYIKLKKECPFLARIKDSTSYFNAIQLCLNEYRTIYTSKSYRNASFMFDRVYVSTLFTFYWNITIKTINFAKTLIKDNNLNELKIGGVAATVLADDMEKETGIKPYKGLLNKKGILDKGNKDIIDELPLDYSILEEIDYKYPATDAYYGYATRGCGRRCAFCAVQTIEPDYNPYINICKRIKESERLYGKKRNLLLLDNNVFKSDKFPKIISDIKKCGFAKGDKYTPENELEFSINALKLGTNDNAYIKKSYYILQNLVDKLSKAEQKKLCDKLIEYELVDFNTTTKENLIKIYPEISDLYLAHFKPTARDRYVDFNQGVDARYVTEETMQLLSQIPIRPLRIAFDSLSVEKEYVNAIELAAKYDIRNLSNYLLYNFMDKPEDLYRRLDINVNLCDSLKVNIYSFPMKYHPITGEFSKNRDYLGKHWNRKFIRAVQAVLNATKGKIGRGKSFFKKAFGENLEEFNKILYMPETYIIYRLIFEENGEVHKWYKAFKSLSAEDLSIAKKVIETNDFKNLDLTKYNKSIAKVLRHYLVHRNYVKQQEVKS